MKHMLIRNGMNFKEIFHDFQHELRRGALDRKHPFRFITLATIHKGIPQARYVVLRSVDEALNLFIYTDYRTSKIQELSSLPQVSVLLYHPQQRVQVRIQAEATIHKGDKLAKSHWAKVQGDAQKAYNSTLAPSTIIHSPEEAFAWHDELSNDEYFAVVTLKPHFIELLQLNGLEHFRLAFTSFNNNWEGEWLVP